MGDIGNRPLTRVDIEVQNNVWWDDAFQFGDPLDQTWTFTGVSFYLAVKSDPEASTVLLSCSSVAGTIVVADPINRILNMLVTDEAMSAALVPGHYVYDLIMVQTSGQTDGLMYGSLVMKQGVTEGPS